MPTYKFVNFVEGRLTERLTSGAGTLRQTSAKASGGGLWELLGGPITHTGSETYSSSRDVWPIVIDPNGTPEIVFGWAMYEHNTGLVEIYIERGQEGTTARTHANNTRWRHTITAGAFHNSVLDGDDLMEMDSLSGSRITARTIGLDRFNTDASSAGKYLRYNTSGQLSTVAGVADATTTKIASATWTPTASWQWSPVMSLSAGNTMSNLDDNYSLLALRAVSQFSNGREWEDWELQLPDHITTLGMAGASPANAVDSIPTPAIDWRAHPSANDLSFGLFCRGEAHNFRAINAYYSEAVTYKIELYGVEFLA